MKVFVWRYLQPQKKIRYGQLDLTAFTGVSDQIHIILAALENATFQNRVSRAPTKPGESPVLTGLEVRLNTIGRTLIKIVLRIPPIPKSRWNGNDALMLIVGKSDKDVDDPGGGFRDAGDRERREGEQRQRDPS